MSSKKGPRKQVDRELRRQTILERAERSERRDASWKARFEKRKVSDLRTGQVIWIQPTFIVETIEAMGEKLHFREDEAEQALIPHIVLPLSDDDKGRSVVAKLCTRKANLTKMVEAKLNQPGKQALWKHFIPDHGQSPVKGSG